MRLRRKAKEPKVPLATKNENMTLTQHLAELRMRLIRCLLAVVLFGVLVFVLYDPWIQDFLFHPYREVCAANPNFNCNGNPVLITAARRLHDPHEGGGVGRLHPGHADHPVAGVALHRPRPGVEGEALRPALHPLHPRPVPLRRLRGLRDAASRRCSG